MAASRRSSTFDEAPPAARANEAAGRTRPSRPGTAKLFGP